jgi:hypothetical protein
MVASLIPVVQPKAATECDIVFVHGLGGHHRGTWQAEEWAFWPKWLEGHLKICGSSGTRRRLH